MISTDAKHDPRCVNEFVFQILVVDDSSQNTHRFGFFFFLTLTLDNGESGRRLIPEGPEDDGG